MNPEDLDKIGDFLSRWSRRKLEQVQPAPEPAAPPAVESASVPATESAATVQDAPPAELPPVESLTPESDFKPFMQPDVDAGVKNAALKQLFKDPHFNVMDGLDTYIDDYSVEDPIPEAMMKNLYQARQHLFSDEEKAAADRADAAAAEAAATDSPETAVIEASQEPGPQSAPAVSAEPVQKDT